MRNARALRKLHLGRFADALAVGLLFLRCVVATSAEIPRDRYLVYLPLEYPKFIRETEANRELRIFGDESSPDYVDQSPRDGIDDRCAAIFKNLALRFSPYLVLNTSNFPMDFEKVQEIQDKTQIIVDDWDVSGPDPKRTGSQEIQLRNVRDAPCPPKGDPRNDDCRLIELLEDFDPHHPQNPWLRTPTVGPRSAPFSVPYIDFIGDSPESWKAEYTDPETGGVPAKYQGTKKTYVHPLVASRSANEYDFVLQYWFFYPLNDAANKHKGDWEHINAVITPRSKVGKGLTASEIQLILKEGVTGAADSDPLVISRVDYYFHAFVMSLDFSAPNAYLPKEEWEAEVRKIPPDRIGAGTIARQIREVAWEDEAETRINTHPVGYIGADSKGIELLLFPPGARNRDGHGTYPFPGIYKNIGPVSAAEEIRKSFSLREHLKSEKPLPEDVMTFDRPEEIELLADWERLLDGVRANAGMRRKWYWMLIPLRWGYPAVDSPFAGIISHAETGNISSLAPPFNVAWNRPGTSQATAAYEPNRYVGLFPLSPIDALQNDWGWLNVFVVQFTSLPVLDMAYKLGVSPVSGLISGYQAVYSPSYQPPLRTLSLGVGESVQSMEAEAWNVLYLNNPQFGELIATIDRADPAHGQVQDVFADEASSLEYQIQFYLGQHISTQTTLRHASSSLGFDVGRSGGADPFRVRGEVEMWELSGAFRYSLLTNWIQPFVKLGYGWSWYRLRNVSIDGSALSTPDSAWVEQPSFFPFENLFPNEWHFGAGVELIPVRRYGPLFNGLDFGLKLDLTYTMQKVETDFVSPIGLGLQAPNPSTHRFGISLVGVVSL